MPRTPQNIARITQFGGRIDGAAVTTPNGRAAGSLNVMTDQRDVRRRPGLRQSNFPPWSPTAYRWLRVMRIFGFICKPYGDDPVAVLPCAALLAWCDAGASDPNPDALRLFLITLGAGVNYYDGVTGAFTPHYYNSAGVPVHRFDLCWLGDALLRRSNPGGIVINAKDGHSTVWTNWDLFVGTPTSVTLTAVVGSSLVAGTYQYIVTYVNSRLGLEGPVTWPAASITIAAPDRRIQVTASGTPGAGVDKFRVYRLHVGVDSEYYLVGEVAVGGTFLDTNNDDVVDKSASNRLDVSYDYEVGLGNACAIWQDRLWLDENPNMVFCSEPRRFAAFALTSSWSLGRDPGDEVCRIMPTPDGLFFLKNRGIWIITGSSPESYDCRPLAEGDAYGLRSQAGAIAIGSTVFYAAQRGLMAVTVSSLECLSDQISDLWARFKARHAMTIAYDGARDLIVVAGYTDDQMTQPYALACHVPSRSWHEWELGQSGVGNAVLETDGESTLLVHRRYGLTPADPTEGGLAALQSEDRVDQTDLGAAVPWFYDANLGDCGVDYLKHVHYGYVQMVRNEELSGDVTLTTLIDQAEDGAEISVDAGIAAAGTPFPLGFIARTLALRVGGSHLGRPRVREIGVGMEVVGNR